MSSGGIALSVDEGSAVAEARRQASIMAGAMGFNEERAGVLALVVTEAVSNMVKHAGNGTLVLQRRSDARARGVEVLALDRGPGMASVAASMRDGHSTAGSPGWGMGALSRLASDLQIHSRSGEGTILRCVVWRDDPPAPPRHLEYGAVCVPLKGELVSGDSWGLHASGCRHRLIVVDGLGHGPEAAEAARRATEVVENSGATSPQDCLESVHLALRPTRGAAAAVVDLRPAGGTGAFCGVGNIGCMVCVGDTSRSLASHNGILGHQARKFQTFDFPFPAGALLYAYSDGMTSRWDPSAYPGLVARHPSLIAGALFRDHSRGRDDTTIVVIRNLGTEVP